ncbi:hypothetical protein HK18_04955, partial [Commensalibacter intestini]
MANENINNDTLSDETSSSTNTITYSSDTVINSSSLTSSPLTSTYTDSSSITTNTSSVTSDNSDDTTSTTSTASLTQVQTFAEPVSTENIEFPTYNVTATMTGASWATLYNATVAGNAISYTGGANYGTDGNYQFYIGESAGTYPGNAIYDTLSKSFAITVNGGVHVGRGNVFIVGSTSAANLTIATPTTVASKTSASLTLASGSYLSVNGYLGAVASTTVTGFISAADSVSMKIASSYYTVGPATGTVINAQFGNNNAMEIGGTFGVYQNASTNIGSNLSLNAGALAVGNNNASIVVGDNANVQVSGDGVLVYGSSTWMQFGSNLTLSASTMSFGANAAGGTQTNNTFSVGTGGNITVDNGVIANQSNGVVELGTSTNLHLINGDLSIGGAGNATGARSWFHMLGDNTLTLDTGSIIMTNTSQTFDWGTSGNISANSLSVNGNNLSFTMNTNASVNLSGSLILDGTSDTMSFGDSLNLNVGTLTTDGNSNLMTLGNELTLNASIVSLGGSTGVTGTQVSAGNNASITISNGFSDNLSNGVASFGSGGHINVLAGDFSVGGAGVDSGQNWVHMGSNNTLSIHTGSLIMTNTSQTFDWGDAGTLVADTVNVSGNNLTFSMGTAANVDLSGTLALDGNTNQMIFGDQLILNVNSVSLGGTAGVGNTSLTVGKYSYFTIYNGFTDNLSNGTVQFEDQVNVSILSGDFSAGGTNISDGDRNWIYFGNDNTLTLDNGSIIMNNSGQTLNFGLNATINASSLNISGNDLIFSANNSANINFTDSINISATSTTLTFGDSTIMSVGTGGINLNTSTNFIYGQSGTLDVNGDITLGLNAEGTVFTIGDNTHLSANNIIINANNPVITLGSNIIYNTTGWVLNGTNDNIALGDGASGSLGNITFGGNASGASFNTGSAGTTTSALTFGNATLVNDATLTLNGNVSGSSVDLSGTAIVSIVSGTTVNLNSLTMDGSQQVTISVGQDATLNISSLTTSNVGSDNIPKIIVNGGTVVVAGQETRATSSLAAHEVDFAGIDNGIYQYTGSIQDANNQLTVTDFTLSDKLVFSAQEGYLEETRYVTSYADGILTVGYVNATTGETETLAKFNYSPADSSQDVPNVIIQESSSSPTGYDLIITQCFLTGTHLLTPEGEVTVENLKAGDQVITLENGQQVSKEIVWAGTMDVNVNHYENKGPLYPVRIKAHAFGLNQPCRDLLVPPEHTIFVDGGLIPARMLVNGRSIIVDTTI